MPRLNLSPADSLKMGQLIADAWRFPAKRKALLENPEQAMTDAGITIPDVDQVRIVAIEDTPTTVHLVLPVRPGNVSGTDLTDNTFLEELGTKVFAACR